MTNLALHVVSETASTITLGWQPPVCVGYVFYRNGLRVSNTWDPTVNQAKFKKVPSGQYEVWAVGAVATGTYPAAAPPPNPDPPPVSNPYLTADWANGVVPPWHKTGTDNQFATAPGLLALTNGPGSSGPNQSSWMTAADIYPADAHAAPGDNTKYTIPITFPQNYKATSGEWNWIVAWHVADPTPQALSCALGVFAEGPVGGPNDPPGTNPKLFFVVRGGTVGNITEKRYTLPTTIPLGVKQTHQFTFHWQRAPAVGQFEWKIDDQTVWTIATVNMLNDGLPNGFGLYNYRRVATWDATVQFGTVTIGPA